MESDQSIVSCRTLTARRISHLSGVYNSNNFFLETKSYCYSGWSCIQAILLPQLPEKQEMKAYSLHLTWLKEPWTDAASSFPLYRPQEYQWIKAESPRLFYTYFEPEKVLGRSLSLFAFWWCWDWRQGHGHLQVSWCGILINNFTSLSYWRLPGLTVQNCPENPKGLDTSSAVNTQSRIHSHRDPITKLMKAHLYRRFSGNGFKQPLFYCQRAGNWKTH